MEPCNTKEPRQVRATGLRHICRVAAISALTYSHNTSWSVKVFFLWLAVLLTFHQGHEVTRLHFSLVNSIAEVSRLGSWLIRFAKSSFESLFIWFQDNPVAFQGIFPLFPPEMKMWSTYNWFLLYPAGHLVDSKCKLTTFTQSIKSSPACSHWALHKPIGVPELHTLSAPWGLFSLESHVASLAVWLMKRVGEIVTGTMWTSRWKPGQSFIPLADSSSLEFTQSVRSSFRCEMPPRQTHEQIKLSWGLVLIRDAKVHFINGQRKMVNAAQGWREKARHAF